MQLERLSNIRIVPLKYLSKTAITKKRFKQQIDLHKLNTIVSIGMSLFFIYDFERVY